VNRARRLWAFWSARPTLGAAVIYAVLAVLMVGQGVLPGRTLSGSDTLLSSVPWQASKPASVPGLGTNFELADSADVFGPMLQYTRSRLPTVPLWNPYIMAGRPLLADGQSAVFSPFSVVSYVLPFWKSLAVVAMLKLFLGAFGAYLFGRLLGMRFGGALVTGLVFAFGTFFVVWLAWPLTSVYAWIPWALAACELVVRRPGRLSVAALAAVVGLQLLGGHPESSFHLMFVLVVFFVFRALLDWRRRSLPKKALVRPTVAFAIAMIAGTALAALVLAPLAEFVLHSGDLSRRANAAAGYWPRKYLGALFLHDYWGRPTQLDLAAFMQVRGWYAGAATLMLAAAGLILRRTAERIAVVVFALFCVCMVVGIKPVFGLVSGLPGFSAAHNERLLIYFLLCIALLAGWGIDDLSAVRLPRPSLRRAVLISAGVIVCIPIVWLLVAGTLSVSQLSGGLRVAWGFEHPPLPASGLAIPASTGAIIRDSALLIWLPLAGAAFALIAARLWGARRLGVTPFVALTVLLLAADLFRANMGFNPAIKQSTAVPPPTGAIRYLQSQRPNRFIGVSTIQLSQPLPDDLAMRFGLYDARGYDFPVEKRFDDLWRASVAPGVGDFTQPEEFASATPASLRALSLLSVSDLLVGPLQAIATPLHGPGLHVAYKGKDGVVYANSNALPRVFVVDRQRTIANDKAELAAVTAPGFNGRGVAVTEHAVAGVQQAASTTVAPSGPVTVGVPNDTSAKLASYGAEKVVIDATATATKPSLVVLTDSFYPGWKATVDGKPAPIERVDYVLRGVSIGPGHHTIVMRYQPASWRIGWIVSLVALLALLGALASVWIGKRRRRAAATT
jgi:Bacterial membrane protein YfhO